MSATGFLGALRSFIRPDLVVDGALDLFEDDAGSTLPALRLKKHGRPLLIRPDLCGRRPGQVAANDRLFPLVKLDGGLARHCDYVIAHAADEAHEAVLFLLFIELKSGAANDARLQIENTRLLIDGLVAAAQHHGRAHPPTIVRRGVTFAGKARTPKGRRCPYDVNPRMRDLPCATIAPFEHHLDYFCHQEM